MAILAVLRHGPTEWNAERRLQGRTDRPLSAAGRVAVRQWRLPPWAANSAWLSSPLTRCAETAQILLERSGAAEPLRIEPLLIEMSYGAWEGRKLPDLRAELGREMAELEARGLDFRAPGGESPRDVQARLHRWLLEIGTSDGTTVAITHKGIIRAIYALATGWTMTAQPRHKLRMDALQLFDITPDGAIGIARLNLPILDEATTP